LSRSPRYALPDHLCRFGVRAADPLARGFSRQPRITHFAQMGSASGLRLHARRICLPCVLHRYPGTTIARDGLPSCVTPSLAYDQPPPARLPERLPKEPPSSSSGLGWARHWRGPTGTGVSTRCPSTTPVGLALGPDSPRAEQPGPGTLGHPAGKILTSLALLMPAFSLAPPPPHPHRAASPVARRSPTHPHP
jgi:hypothetical protein